MPITGPRPSYLRNSATLPPYGQPQYPQTPKIAPPQIPGATTAPAPAPKPTFEPPQTGIDPTAASTSQPDPRIASLMTALNTPPPQPYQQPSGQVENLQGEIRKLTDNPISPQSESTQALFSALMHGQAPDIGDINADPAAVAYRVSRERDAARARVEEAARLGASGATGGGESDARNAQIREAAAEDVARFTGNLASERRGEAIQSALSAASLEAADRQRQDATRLERASALQRLMDSIVGQESTARTEATQKAQFATESQQRLLAALLAEQSRVQDAARQDATQAEIFRRQAADKAGTPYYGGFPAGTTFTRTGAPIVARR